MNKPALPKSFLITEPAWYSYKIQNVYPDVISFVSAIPIHLRSLFIVPIEAYGAPIVSERYVQIAARLSSDHVSEYIPSGMTPEQGWFGTETFVNYDNENSHPDTSEGSIFDITNPYTRTKHQEYNFDQNIQTPTDTTYMSDVDMSEYFSYPYRLDAYPVRHSSVYQRQGSLVISEFLDSDKLVPWKSGLKDPTNQDKTVDHRVERTKQRYKVYYNIGERARTCVVEPSPRSAKEDFKISSSNQDVGYLERIFRVKCNLINGERGSRKFDPKRTKHTPGGYDVTILERINRNNNKCEFLVTCGCEFFKFTDYFRTMSGQQGSQYRNFVCKHIHALLDNTTNADYLLLTSDSLKQSPESARDAAVKSALVWLTYRPFDYDDVVSRLTSGKPIIQKPGKYKTGDPAELNDGDIRMQVFEDISRSPKFDKLSGNTWNKISPVEVVEEPKVVKKLKRLF